MKNAKPVVSGIKTGDFDLYFARVAYLLKKKEKNP